MSAIKPSHTTLTNLACASWMLYQQHSNLSSRISNAKHLFTPIRFSQITKPRSKPLALEMDVARPHWQAASTGVSIISLPSSQAILLKVLDACKLLTVAVNTSLRTLNRLPNLIDDRGCEDVRGGRMYMDYASPVCHV